MPDSAESDSVAPDDVADDASDNFSDPFSDVDGEGSYWTTMMTTTTNWKF
jgi:hypothetical protein